MHNRHRSPGNGYRSSASSSFGVAPPPPPPPLPRRPNSFPHQPPPPRKADVFAEAGRLAAEYLVSQGFLPPTVLSSSSSSSAAAFKRSLRPPPPLPDSPDNFSSPEGRTSALARLGNPAARRRFNADDFRSKTSSTRRRPYRGYGGSDWGRDYGRTSSFNDRFGRDSPDLEADADADGDSLSEPPPPPRDDLPPKNEEEAAPAPEPAPEISNEDLNLKQSVRDDDRTVEDCSDKQNVNKASSSSSEVVVADKEKEICTREDDSSNNTTPDLRTMCKFAKVPTRTRSSKTSKTPKVDPIPASEVDKEVLVSEESCGILKTKTAKSGDDNVGRVSEVYYDLERDKGAASSSQERGEKRGLEEVDNEQEQEQEERAKRQRDWLPSSSVVVEEGDCFNMSKLIPKGNENSMVNNSQFTKHGDGEEEEEDGIGFSQEKQLFPSSFKICDLNLMEVSDAHESREGDPMMIYPAMKREASPIDVDLSISNSTKTNPAGETSRRPLDSKEIEVIDLENDSAQEDKDVVMEDRKTETVYTDLEGFPNHAQNTGDMPDVQDGYGYMISELLRNDFPNCSSVPGNINPLHNDIGLHNGEGALADDDSIYMSLGEIPLTFLPWEQPPPQGYEKPF